MWRTSVNDDSNSGAQHRLLLVSPWLQSLFDIIHAYLCAQTAVSEYAIEAVALSAGLRGLRPFRSPSLQLTFDDSQLLWMITQPCSVP